MFCAHVGTAVLKGAKTVKLLERGASGRPGAMNYYHSMRSPRRDISVARARGVRGYPGVGSDSR